MGFSTNIRTDLSVNIGNHNTGGTSFENGNAVLSFNDVFRDNRTDFEDYGVDDMIRDGISTVSAGHTIEMLGARSKIKDTAFEDELDTMISFDEIEELDGMIEDAVSLKKDDVQGSVFEETDIFADGGMTEDEELMMMSDLDEIEDIM